MNVYSEEEMVTLEPLESHCQHYLHDYKCDDHKFNGTDCSKCEFRHRTFVELSDILQVISDPVLKEQINNLPKYITY